MHLDQHKHLNDEELVARIIHEGKTELFELLYKRYFFKVVDKSYSFIKNKSMAEDFANDILAKAYEKLPGFKGNSLFSSWLYAITYNYSIDYLRLKKKLHYPNWNSENEIPDIPDESEADLEEMSYDKLLIILERIHPEEKALLLMKYQDNLPGKAIAQTLRISEDAVKMRLKRARTRVIYLYQSMLEKD
ncbi:RNA polymerase sigma factor [Mangrovibacterium marinum]|uniref:RNA polymerase sigma-70 factor (ECF subfamily) n=1 Tax=Mangrovibacterium marinum TaxID=1639118 RepID=A0A2T5C2A7_9BACT|nr:RNA polymerase sigma factor [Mangrovibacterium marinum]PTN08818.1 RNA polymerase sigma-70 factor (ECF subfamily) [Mangrovibacterium marinum]